MNIKALRHCAEIVRSADRLRKLKRECAKLDKQLRQLNKPATTIYESMISAYHHLKEELSTNIEWLRDRRPDMCKDDHHQWTTPYWQVFTHTVGDKKIVEYFKRCGLCDYKLSTFEKPQEVKDAETQGITRPTQENDPIMVEYLQDAIQKSLKMQQKR